MSSKNCNRKDVCPGCLSYVDAEKMEEMVGQTWLYGTNKSKVRLQLQCSIRPKMNGVECPCSTCLVKMVCDITCGKLDDYHVGLDIIHKRPRPK